jgi:transcriptional regulator with XRE-family HTH domain
MSPDEGSLSSAGSPQERFSTFLDELAGKGITQQEAARRLGVSPQYISDCRAGRRGISELFARRLEEEFHRPRGWFLDDDTDQGGERPLRESLGGRSARTHLPVFPHPIQGDPYRHRLWSGSEIEVCGLAAVRALAARQTYLLELGIDDRRGRLRRHDLILISQETNSTAELQVLELANKAFLARRKQPRGWEALSASRSVSGDPKIIGHCIGVVWAAL